MEHFVSKLGRLLLFEGISCTLLYYWVSRKAGFTTSIYIYIYIYTHIYRQICVSLTTV